MMSHVPEQSPGETAYTAYWPALGAPPPVPWAGLSAVVQAAWEAAAFAVLTWKEKEDHRDA
jgi:hypothetical protein